jgi:DNA polymerase-3 subunit chi
MTTFSLSSNVRFLTVTDNASKLQQLCAVVNEHFAKGDSMLIAVPTPEAAAYLDQLLWKMPEESFMPHSICNNPTQDRVVITTAAGNINQAKILLNLLPSIHPNSQMFACIYELYDQTSPEKEELSRKKQAHYSA